MILRVCASSAPNGSSISRIDGSQASMRAMATRCCIPPDSRFGKVFSKPQSFTMSMKACAVRRRSALPTPRSASPYSTLPSTVFQGNSAKCWNTMPRSGPGSLMAVPRTRISPAEQGTKPPIMCSSVDLPQPLGPMMETNSPSPTDKATRSMAVSSRSLPSA